MHYGKRILSSEKGFVLVTAILACVILLALTTLIINLSTSDLRTSSQRVGEKKALSAAEAGLHRLMASFDPASGLGTFVATDVQVDATNDPHTVYSIAAPVSPTTGPEFLPLTGYAIGGGQQWGQKRYTVDIIGRNTTYKTRISLGAGMGFGPVEITTMMR